MADTCQLYLIMIFSVDPNVYSASRLDTMAIDRFVKPFSARLFCVKMALLPGKTNVHQANFHVNVSLVYSMLTSCAIFKVWSEYELIHP